MKRLFSLSVLMVAFCSFSFATVRTLCNMPYSPGQYNNFNDAQNASIDGDTIYVHGSTIDYGSINIDRALVVIGTGHHPDKQNPLVSSFNQITISSHNVQLIGLRMNHVFTFSYINGAIKKCRIMGSSNYESLGLAYADNWLIEGNIIESPSFYSCISFGGTASPNTIVQNNIFLSTYEKIGGVNNNSSQRTYFINNVFLGQFISMNTFFDVRYSTLDNNIFYSSMPNGTNFSNCLMNNNISYAGSDNTFYQPGSNNIIVDPLFNYYPGFQSMYDYNWDLGIDVTSPGHNYGTDGTDLGVFGGLGFIFTETGEPSIAEITAFTITSPTVIAPGGSLTISVTSKRVH